jgi:hypothetical protein
MQVIKDNKSLAAAIAHLENVHKSEGNLLKQHFEFTMDSLNPMNIIKEKFNETIASPTIKSKILKGTFGLVTGLLFNKFMIGSSNNPFTKAISTLVQTNVSRLTVNNSEAIKSSGISFLKTVLTKMKINPSK